MNLNIYNNIDLNLYKSFLIVSETGSISKAAEQLCVSQPAISYSIRTLEKALNVKLFNRESKGVSLTSEGNKLKYYIKTAFNNIYAGEKFINGTVNMQTGEIRIGVPSHIGSAILTNCITKFNELYPYIKFVIVSKSTVDMMEMLDSKQLDIVIDSFPIMGNKYEIDTYNLFELENCLVVSKKYSDILNKAPVNIEILKEYPLILPIESSSTRSALEDQFNYSNEKFEPIIEVYSSELLIDFVKNGIGIGYCPKLLAKKYINSGEIFEVFTEVLLPKTQVCLVYPPRYLSHASVKFINLLKEITNAEKNPKQLELIKSSTNKTINSDDISYLYDCLKNTANINSIFLHYNLFINDINSILDRLNKIKANITLEIEMKDIETECLNNFSMCNNIFIHTKSQDITISNEKIMYKNIDLNYVFEYIKCNTILSIDIENPQKISFNKLKQIIDISSRYHINIQFNEPFVDEYDSHYSIRSIETFIKKYDYIQSYQNINKRIFSNKGHIITIFRNFCAVASSKNKPDNYCNSFNSIKITLDAKMFQCRESEKHVDFYESIKNRDATKLDSDIKIGLENLGKCCKYKNGK